MLRTPSVLLLVALVLGACSRLQVTKKVRVSVSDIHCVSAYSDAPSTSLGTRCDTVLSTSYYVSGSYVEVAPPYGDFKVAPEWCWLSAPEYATTDVGTYLSCSWGDIPESIRWYRGEFRP